MIGLVIFYLIIIIGLFFVIVKFLSKKNRWMMQGRAVKNYGGATLAQNKSVQVVEIGSSLYILGVGDSVTLLCKIDDPGEVETIREQLQGGNREMQGFPSVKDWWKNRTVRKGQDGEELAEFETIFQNQLQALSNRKKKVDDLIQDEPYTKRQSRDEE